MQIEKVAVQAFNQIKRRAPLIHNITNFVVMNSSAGKFYTAFLDRLYAAGEAEIKEFFRGSEC